MKLVLKKLGDGDHNFTEDLKNNEIIILLSLAQLSFLSC